MKRGLFLVQLPPPIHGVSVVNHRIVTDTVLAAAVDMHVLSTEYTATLADIGRFSLRKVVRWLQLLLAFVKRLFEDRPDFVYFTPVVTGARFALDVPFIALAKLFRRRLILHLHGRGVAERARYRPWRSLYEFAFSNCALISASSGMREHEFSPLRLVGARKYVIENAVDRVDVDRYRVAAEPGEPARLLFLSATFPAKGIFVLLSALRLLADRGVAFRAEIAGASAPALDESICRTIEATGLAGVVRATGARYGDDKWRSFGRADIFVHPTLNDYFPLVLLEAMQFGLPIVATKVGAIGEIVEHECNGLVVAPNDAHALADALERLIPDPELRRRFGSCSRARYLGRYVPERFTAEFRAMLAAEDAL